MTPLTALAGVLVSKALKLVGLSANVGLFPVAVPPVSVTVMVQLPEFESVMLVVRTPLVKLALVPLPEEMVQPLLVICAVPVKFVAVLPSPFLAVMVTLNGTNWF